MENLFIPSTEDTPSIKCDVGKAVSISIEGVSLPENAEEFFNPLHKWMREYIAQPCKKTIVSIKLIYMNSASTRQLVDFLVSIEILLLNEQSVEVFWFHKKDDELIKSKGEEITEILEIPIKIMEY